MLIKRLFSILFCIGSSLSALGQDVETVVQQGHYESIKGLAFSADGRFLLTGSRDKTAKLWDIETGWEIRTFIGHTSTINHIALTPDQKYFLTSNADYTAKLWDIASGDVVRTLAGHDDLLTTVDISPDGKLAVTAGFNTYAKIWDLPTGETLKEFKVNPEKGLGFGVNAKFSPDGKWIAFGNDNRTVTIYDLESEELVYEFKREEGWCGGCATYIEFSSDGSWLLFGSNNGAFKTWNLKTGKEDKVFVAEWDEFRAIDISHDDSLIMLAGEDSVKVWNYASGDLVLNLGGIHEEPINEAALSPDGRFIATASDDRTVKLLDLKTGEEVKTLQGYLNLRDRGGLNYDANSRWEYYIKKYTDLRNEIKISPDGKHMLKGKIGNILRMWELASGNIVQEFYGHEKAVLCYEFSKDGKQIVTGSADNTAKLWDAASGELIRTFEGHRELVFSIDISPDGKQLLTGSWDGTAKIWDIETGELIDTFRFKDGSPYALSFSSNGLYIFTGLLDKTFKMWEIDTKREVRDFIGHSDNVPEFDFHPSLSQVASVSWDGKIKIWEIATGLQTMKLTNHKGPVHTIQYDQSGKYLATGGDDRVVRLWDAYTGKEVKSFEGHTSPVISVHFTPDSKYLVSASRDDVIKIWDLQSGKELFSHISIGERDWMVQNAKGYFNATEGARNAIVFVKGLDSYGVNQFFEEFYQPELLKDVFGNKNQLDNKINLLDKIRSSPPPQIEILSPTAGEEANHAKAELFIKVTNAGGDVDEIKVLHNGKRLDIDDSDVFAKLKSGKSVFRVYDLELVPGRNSIEVSAFSKGRVESKPVKTTVKYGESEPKEPKLYVLAVGINEYVNPQLNLNYAKADASGFSELVASKSKGLFEDIEVVRIYDKEATKENIFFKLEQLTQKIKPEDVFFFYFAGHGSMVDETFYFIPTENVRLYASDKLRKTAINAEELQRKFKRISALKQLVVIDACQSGGSVELLAQRGAVEEKALAQLSRSAGVHVLSSAGSEQFASEFKELGHGIFTYVLLEGLNGKADGSPKDGKVTIYELKSYLDDQVPEFSKKFKGKLQFPYTFSRGHDFPLVLD
ncbi:MAG: caspase family protein [Bacteroidota bacterium]